MKKYFGSCLCKKVAFEIVGEFSAFFLCHCSRCRKESGSAHGANLFSHTAEIFWLSGQEHVKTFRLEGTRFARSFCVSCGSAAPTIETGNMVIPAGSLDSDVDIRPNGHICMASKANWDTELELIAKHELLPK